MKITSKGRYGIKAMMELHRAEGLLKNREIAEKHNIPVKYLEQIINLLKKNHLVKSVRGAEGGYRLAVPGKEITLFQILECLEGDLSILDKSDTNWTESTSEFWAEIDKFVSNYLSITLEEFVLQHETTKADLMYFI